MLNQGFFKDAFILHSESTNKYHLNDLLRCIRSPEAIELCMNRELVIQNDKRLDLYEKWAKFKNLFEYQPFGLINDYFGKRIALYFLWAGAFITALLIPSIIGTIFFLIGFGFS